MQLFRARPRERERERERKKIAQTTVKSKGNYVHTNSNFTHKHIHKRNKNFLLSIANSKIAYNNKVCACRKSVFKCFRFLPFFLCIYTHTRTHTHTHLGNHVHWLRRKHFKQHLAAWSQASSEFTLLSGFRGIRSVGSLRQQIFFNSIIIFCVCSKSVCIFSVRHRHFKGS